jgi:SPX domain protein involved in polyphosphate accumulation
MKFGQHLKTALVREYQYQYFDYNSIKKEVWARSLHGLRVDQDENEGWAEVD